MTQFPVRLVSSSTVYTDVKNGTGSFTQLDWNTTSLTAGQTFDGTTYESHETLWAFDSSVLFETPSKMYAFGQNSGTNPVVLHCAQLAFGNPISFGSDWQTPAQLAALTKLGTATVPSTAVNFGEFVIEIDTSGMTFGGDVNLIFWTDDQENGVAPAPGSPTITFIYDLFVRCPNVDPGAVGTYATEVAADSPTLWWRLGELSGTVAADSSGNGHTGTYFNAPTLNQPGLVGDADRAVTLSNAATNSIVSTTDFGGTDFSGAGLSIECVVNLGFTTSTYFVLAGFEGDTAGSNSFTTEIDLEFNVQGRTATEFVMIAYVSGPRNYFLLEQNTPTHVAMSVPATGNMNLARIFTNGELWQTVRPTADIAPITGLSSPDFFYGGGDPSTSSDTMDGTLDEVALYSTALTTSRVRVHTKAAGLPAAGNPGEVFDHVGITGTIADGRHPVVNLFDAVGVHDVLSVIVPINRIYTVTKPDFCRDPSYNPNGNTIVIAEKIGSQNQLAQINTNGSGHTVLLTGTSPFFDPTWSADGMFLLYAQETVAPNGGHPHGQWAIRYLDPTGTVITIVNDANANMHPVWITPTQIAFQRQRYGTDTTFHIVLMDTAGVEIADLGAGEYPRLVVV